MVSILLAFNRCVELIYPPLNEIVFSPKMLTTWLVAASLYGTYFILFTVPIKFSGIYLSWFLYPYVGYTDKDAGFYHNVMHYTNNTIESVSLAGMYAVFCIFLVVRSAVIGGVGPSAITARRNFKIRSFIQVFLISLVNTVACSVSCYFWPQCIVLLGCHCDEPRTDKQTVYCGRPILLDLYSWLVLKPKN